MFSTFPYKAIKYQFSSDLPLITLTGIGFQNITDHSYSWHNLHRHDKHCLIQYCISGQGILTINNSTYLYHHSWQSFFTKCERKAPKFIYGDISSLKNNDSISLFFIVLYF